MRTDILMLRQLRYCFKTGLQNSMRCIPQDDTVGIAFLHWP